MKLRNVQRFRVSSPQTSSIEQESVKSDNSEEVQFNLSKADILKSFDHDQELKQTEDERVEEMIRKFQIDHKNDLSIQFNDDEKGVYQTPKTSLPMPPKPDPYALSGNTKMELNFQMFKTSNQRPKYLKGIYPQQQSSHNSHRDKLFNQNVPKSQDNSPVRNFKKQYYLSTKRVINDNNKLLQNFKDKVLRIILHDGSKESSLQQVYQQVKIYEKLFLTQVTEQNEVTTNQKIKTGNFNIQEPEVSPQKKIDLKPILENLDKMNQYVQNDIQDVKDLREFIEAVKLQNETKQLVEKKIKPSSKSPSVQLSLVAMQKDKKKKEFQEEKQKTSYVDDGLNFFIRRKRNGPERTMEQVKAKSFMNGGINVTRSQTRQNNNRPTHTVCDSQTWGGRTRSEYNMTSLNSQITDQFKSRQGTDRMKTASHNNYSNQFGMDQQMMNAFNRVNSTMIQSNYQNVVPETFNHASLRSSITNNRQVNKPQLPIFGKCKSRVNNWQLGQCEISTDYTNGPIKSHNPIQQRCSVSQAGIRSINYGGQKKTLSQDQNMYSQTDKILQQNFLINDQRQMHNKTEQQERNISAPIINLKNKRVKFQNIKRIEPKKREWMQIEKDYIAMKKECRNIHKAKILSAAI